MTRKPFFIILLLVFFLPLTSLSANATVSGTITSASTGLPISGALITAYRNGSFKASSTSSADGSYTFTTTPGNRYTITATASGYQSQSVGDFLENNQSHTHNFSLTLGGGAISGKITDTSDTPISGATVELYNSTILQASTTTDGSGDYSFNDLSPGNYIINAFASSYQTSLSSASVTSGGTTTINLSLAASPGSISGTITAATAGAALENVFVEIFNGITLVYSTVTDSNGDYSVANLPPAVYTVSVKISGYRAASLGASVTAGNTTSGVDFALEDSPGAIAGRVTSVNGTALAGALLELFNGANLVSSILSDSDGNYTFLTTPPGLYSLRATNLNYKESSLGVVVTADTTTSDVNFALEENPGSISGNVTESGAGALSGVFIQVYNGAVLVSSTVTDTSGNYEITNLNAGSYNVIASLITYETGYLGAIVSAGTETTGIDFTLETSPGQITGNVSASGGGNIEGALIEIYSNAILLASTFSDVSGNYQFNSLPAGIYLLSASATNYELSSLSSHVSAGSTTTGVNFSLDASPGGLSGAVTNASSTPLEGALVELYSNSILIASVLTDSSGFYSFSGLSAADYIVTTTANGYQSSSLGVTVTSNTTTTGSNFSLLDSPGSITGQVTTSGGSGIESAIVELYFGLNLTATNITDPSGNYSFTNISPGAYTLSISAPSYQSNTQDITVVAGEETSGQNITLSSSPGTITGSVSGSGSGALTGAIVELYQETTLITTTLTDVNGDYTISGLAAGDYSILASFSGFQNAVDTATVSTGSTTSGKNFTLSQNPGTLTGQITSRCTASGISSVVVFTVDDTTVAGFAVSDIDGNYSITGLSAGTYSVEATAINYQSGSTTAVVTTGNTTSGSSMTLTPLALNPENPTTYTFYNLQLTRADHVFYLAWSQSLGECTTKYLIYRDNTYIGAVLSTEKLEYYDYGQNGNTRTYTIKTENSYGLQSSGISLTLTDPYSN